MDAKQFYGRQPLRTVFTSTIEENWKLLNHPNSLQQKSSESRRQGHEDALHYPYMCALLGPSVIWKTFPRQIDALQYRQSCGAADVHVFAYESESLNEGRRRFLVTSYEHFWHTYKQLKDLQRHHYEVITEGTPVKLYFDLEFSKDVNFSRNPEVMVDIFVEQVLIFLEETYMRSFRGEEIIKLDASTPAKFSQHVMFPHVIFRDNLQAGFFVSRICESFRTRLQDPANEKCQLEELIVKTKDGTSAFFVDEGVYTKNRNFRLYYSSKLGKNNPLVLAPDSYVQDKTMREIFFLSLICNVLPADQKEERLLGCDEAEFPSRGLLPRPHCVRNQLFFSGGGITGSQYPELDKFVEFIITSGTDDTHGRIRQWQYFADTETMVYSISGGYKFCERIGRHHKSNNIVFVACLKRGMYHQKCLDPDCRRVDYRSRDYFLPPELCSIAKPILETEEAKISVEILGEQAQTDACVLDFNLDTDGDEFLLNVPL